MERYPICVDPDSGKVCVDLATEAGANDDLVKIEIRGTYYMMRPFELKCLYAACDEIIHKIENKRLKE